MRKGDALWEGLEAGKLTVELRAALGIRVGERLPLVFVRTQGKLAHTVRASVKCPACFLALLCLLHSGVGC